MSAAALGGLAPLVEELLAGRPLAVLTGAGVSAESGLATFRGPGGMWEGRNACAECGTRAAAPDGPFAEIPPRCGCGGLLRPDVVWFGEMLPEGAFEAAAETPLAPLADGVFRASASAVLPVLADALERGAA